MSAFADGSCRIPARCTGADCRQPSPRVGQAGWTGARIQTATNEFAAMNPQCRPSPTAPAAFGQVHRGEIPSQGVPVWVRPMCTGAECDGPVREGGLRDLPAANSFAPAGVPPRAGTCPVTRPAVRAGGLRVFVAANSFALYRTSPPELPSPLDPAPAPTPVPSGSPPAPRWQSAACPRGSSRCAPPASPRRGRPAWRAARGRRR